MARQFKDTLSTVGGISTSANITTTGNGSHSIGSTSNRFSGIYGANIYAYDANAQHYASLRTTTVGTADTQGVGRLIAGNNVASGTAGNAKGQVLLYGTNTGYTALTPGNDTTSNVTVELPSVGGKLMMCVADANNYWGMLPPTGTTSCWMRSPENGLLPYNNTLASSLGGSSFVWKSAFVKDYNIYGAASAGYGYLKPATLGTTDTQGETRLALGNNIAAGNANNAYGRICMYGTDTGYTYIVPGHNGTGGITIKLPSSGGTLARTADLEKYLPLSGGTLTGNVTLERSTANQNTYYVAKRTDTGIGVFMGIGTGGINHGVYSQKLDKWLVYADESKCYLQGNADTATKLNTARTLTIGATGKTFDGSGNVSWSLQDIMKGQGLNYDTACNTLYFNNGGTSHKGRLSCYSDNGSDYIQLALRTADASDNYIALYAGRLSTKGNIKSGAGYSTAAGGITLNEDKNATYYCLDVHRKCDSGSAEYSTARFGCINSYGGCAAIETRQDGSTVGYVRALPNGGIQIGSGKKLHIQNSAPTANVATGDVWIDAG